MSVSEILSGIGSYLQIFGLWIFDLLKALCSYVAIAVSTWLSTFTLPMLPTFLKVFSNEAVNMAIFVIAVLYIIIMNISAFMMFGIDKKRSKGRKKQRVPEKKLMALCFWGGAGGGVLGMQIFRHKTQHRKFTVLVPLMFIIQLVFYSVLLGFLGFWAFF